MKKIILAAVLWSMICGLVYVVNQYDLRQGANDPQIQTVRDMAIAAKAGQGLALLHSPTLVDVRSSLAPFEMVFDQNGKVLSGSGLLDGEQLVVPAGVITHVLNDAPCVDAVSCGEYHVTLQPTKGVRLAAVLRKVALNAKGQQNIVVLSARSLTEVEIREQKTLIMTAGIWFAGMLLLTGFAWFSRRSR